MSQSNDLFRRPRNPLDLLWALAFAFVVVSVRYQRVDVAGCVALLIIAAYVASVYITRK